MLTIPKTSATGISRGFQALSDEKRLQILALLQDRERCVCELVEALEVGQSLLSFHLKTLKDAGLVADRREGRWVHYRLVPEGLAELEEALRSLLEAAGRAGGGQRPCR